jgi:hypothetical protein
VKRHRGPLRKRKSHLWVRQKQDWYVEPLWVSLRLFELEHFGAVWDPACGSGRIVDAARAHGIYSLGSDIVKRTDSEFCRGRKDFFEHKHVYWCGIVSNPPFSRAEEFAKHALKLLRRSKIREHGGKLALLLPSNWIQGTRRSRWLASTPLVRVYFICPRPAMPPGHIKKPTGNGTTDYAWYIWNTGLKRRRQPVIDWLYRDPEPSPRKTPVLPARSR